MWRSGFGKQRSLLALWQASRQSRSFIGESIVNCHSQAAGTQAAVLVHTQQDSRYGSAWQWLLPCAGMVVLQAAAAQEVQAQGQADADKQLPPQPEGWHLLDLDTRRRAFFKYEKRVRDLSSPDKVFQYFSTATDPKGVRLMKPADLLCSLVAVYPPDNSSAVRSGALPGERRPSSGSNDSNNQVSDFFRLFDVDGDGLISYFEYLLIVTFISIPPQDVHIAFQMFDLDDSGSIELREFREVTHGLRQRMRKVSHLQRTGFSSGVEDNQGLIESFFGADGKKPLRLDQFAKFLHDLHSELVQLEFVHYSGNLKVPMRGKDFARTLISGVETRRIDEYIDRVERLDTELASKQISLEDFQTFAVLRRDVHTLEVALEFYHNTVGHLRVEDFARAARKITGRDMSQDLIDIVFAMFDLNNDGDLTPYELIQVLKRREGNSAYDAYSIERQDASGATGLFNCFVSCITRQRGQ